MHAECRVAAIFRLNVLEFAGRDLDKPDVLERALQLFESLLQRSGVAYRNANQAGGDPRRGQVGIVELARGTAR